MSEPITIDPSLSESIPVQSSAPAKVIKLYTPDMVFWLGLFLSLPSALVLCAINWFRLGKRARALTYLAIGSLGVLAVTLFTVFYATDRQLSSMRCLTLGLNLVLLGLLQSQMRTDFSQIQFPSPVYQKESLGRGILISVLTLAGLFVIVFLVSMAISLVAALLTPSHGPILPGPQGWLPLLTLI